VTIVAQRKVTNAYCAMWAAQGGADVRAVIDTARLKPGANSSKRSSESSELDFNPAKGWVFKKCGLRCRHQYCTISFFCRFGATAIE
jgi:hypothetical protein